MEDNGLPCRGQLEATPETLRGSRRALTLLSQNFGAINQKLLLPVAPQTAVAPTRKRGSCRGSGSGERSLCDQQSRT